MVAVKYCEKCNARIDDAPYCMYCEEKSKSKFAPRIIVLIILILLAVTLLLIFK